MLAKVKIQHQQQHRIRFGKIAPTLVPEIWCGASHFLHRVGVGADSSRITDAREPRYQYDYL